ncbi:MAG: TlpA disulfide reductase family protein [Candidatus Marinimicrobia bacterium]|nr:TlpA disulfide reductase family protein [Candidatus Neomarinimicrobiota bacterium]
MKQFVTIQSIRCSIVIVLFSQIGLAQEPAKLSVSDPSPTFYLRTLEGENFFLSKEIKPDSPIILAFYATWCIPCRQEIPALEKMMGDPSLQNVRLYYVNVGGLMVAENGGEVTKQREETDKVMRYRDRFKMTHPILMDRYAMTAQKYGAESLPTLVVIGGEGNIKYLHHGYKPGDEVLLSQLLKDL